MDRERRLFTIDFDGVLTDWSTLDLSPLERRAFFTPPRSVEYAQLRQGAREAAALMSCFGEVAILTSRPARHANWIRRWLRRNAPELGEVDILSSAGPKLQRLRDDHIVLHIDDDFSEATSGQLDRSPSVIIWSGQAPAELLSDISDALDNLQGLRLAAGNEVVTAISPIRVTSSTPTFLVETGSGRRKIRVFTSQNSWREAVDFYDAVSASPAGNFLPRMRCALPFVMITDYVDGEMAEALDIRERAEMIPRLAEFLASLHAIPLPEPSVRHGQLFESDPRLVSCAVDQFNVCRGYDGRVWIIDVVIWAENLYCSDDQQREALITEYMSFTNVDVQIDRVEQALGEYYSWLHFVLMRAKRWNSTNSTVWRAVHDIAVMRGRPPRTSFLQTVKTAA
jgi:hypothetical protein